MVMNFIVWLLMIWAVLYSLSYDYCEVWKSFQLFYSTQWSCIFEKKIVNENLNIAYSIGINLPEWFLTTHSSLCSDNLVFLAITNISRSTSRGQLWLIPCMKRKRKLKLKLKISFLLFLLLTENEDVLVEMKTKNEISWEWAETLWNSDNFSKELMYKLN
jgi:hypothetical protein